MREKASSPKAALKQGLLTRLKNAYYLSIKELRFFADCCCEKGAPSGQLEIKTALYLPCPSWATD